MARLLREQEETAAWELRLRGRRTSATTRDLVRIGGRAALLRWPASAVAHLAGKPALQARLDRLAGSILLVALLLDDLADVADDARTGCCNAVLLAGRASDFHLCVQRGSLFVARWIETELDSIRRDSRGAPGAAAACARLCTAGRRSAASVFRWASAAALANQLRAG
jgi:hypothetical protein